MEDAMSSAKTERAEAARLPGDDVVGVLLTQHARIRDLFDEVGKATGERKKATFDELRAVLAVHETAEEMVVRPVAERIAGKREAEARNHEEEEANRVLADLEEMDVDDEKFDAMLADFEKAVIRHAEHEESEEFPALRDGCDEDGLRAMGRILVQAEQVAPTHPHPGPAGSPAAQWMTGPFASIVDRVKDTIDAARRK
jgi:hemerythrin superfamily protein